MGERDDMGETLDRALLLNVHQALYVIGRRRSEDHALRLFSSGASA